MGCLKNIIGFIILCLAIIGFKVVGGFEFVRAIIDKWFMM